MGLGVVTREDFEAEIRRMERGRGNKKETPAVIRKIAAEEAIIGGGAAKIASEMGLSKSSVDAYKHGATSTATYNEPNKELKNHIDDVKTEISSSARRKLIMALDQITETKLADAPLKVASAIARDMSSIVKDMEPDDDREVENVKFVFFAPAQKLETDFEIIDVTDS